MRTIFVPLVLVLLLALTSSCSGQTAGHDAAPVNVDSSGGAVELAPGQLLVVSLPSNPSTGYSWRAELVPPVLKPFGGEERKPADVQPGLAGAGGTSCWRFVAVESGQGELRLVYQRPWEKGVPPAKSVTYQITVR